jgi:coproporphyrinogen III oxidase-like Fe-S oxidoreductase
MLNYDMPLYRPPSEGRSLIFQVTIGCSFNQCAFCSMYRSKSFRVRELGEVLGEIELLAPVAPHTRRVFLADGDALACPTDHLVSVLNALRARFPKLERVTSYALPANLRRKTDAELRQLREHGLTMIYYGIESGSPDILKRITKGATPHSMVEGLAKARNAGLAISATLVLGLGGRSHWQEHIDGSLDLLSKVELDYLSTLQLTLDPSVAAEFRHKFARPGGNFEPQDDAGMLAEQRRLVAGIEPPAKVVFRSNHASNALPLKGVLPDDKADLLAILDAVDSGEVSMRPLWQRGL